MLKRRVEDQDLADLGNEAHALASDILKSTTAQEIADQAKAALEAFDRFSRRVADLLAGELREGGAKGWSRL